MEIACTARVTAPGISATDSTSSCCATSARSTPDWSRNSCNSPASGAREAGPSAVAMCNTGDDSAYASASPVAALVIPGPVIVATQATRPDARA